MAARKGRLAIRGPSSPDLGQERPGDRLRPSALVDLGVRDDVPATQITNRAAGRVPARA